MSTYLISIYFDEETNEYMEKLIIRIAGKVGNESMLNIPPHITVGMITAGYEEDAISRLKMVAEKINEFELQLVSVGLFASKVVFLQPVLSRGLQELCDLVDMQFAELVHESSRYKPYGWVPHLTLAKNLSGNQQLEVIKLLQGEKISRKVKVKSIGLATTKPYNNVALWDIGESD